MARATRFCLLLALATVLCSCKQKQQTPATTATAPAAGSDAEFIHLLTIGKSEAENRHFAQALSPLRPAVQMRPGNLDARLDLANAYLLLNQPQEAAKEAQQALAIDPNSAAAYYLIGSAELRMQHFEPAVQALQQAKHIEPSVAATSFQLGRAHQGLMQWDAARDALQDAVKLDPGHRSAHYVLSQVLVRLGNQADARRELEKHRAVIASLPNVQPDESTYEKSVYTQMRVPSRLDEQPDPQGVKVTFTDVTAQAFGGSTFTGPVGIIQLNRDGRSNLFVRERDGFRILKNDRGVFHPQGGPLVSIPQANYTNVLVGDLNNDGFDDVVVLGDYGTKAFTFGPDGSATDITASSGLDGVSAAAGVLADLDFTGKLSLWATPPDGSGPQLYRNQGNLTFKPVSAPGVPAVSGVRQLHVVDMNLDDLPDLVVSRDGQPPVLLRNRRGGYLTAEGSPADWPAATAIAVGDLDNDLRPDLVFARAGALEVWSTASSTHVTLPTGDFAASSLYLIDYDNDGWLDIVAAGDGVRVWRNLGRGGFKETTAELGLDKLVRGHVNSIVAADFDDDGDTDLLLDVQGKGLQLLRNDGGNANKQLKLRLVGKRSNASGLGSGVTLVADGWRTSRMYDGFPLEIGTGQHGKIDALTVHWYDLAVTSADVSFDPRAPLTITEIELPTGSCPYLYAWDGKRFRFVSDILGAAPAGLPVAEGKLIDADSEELVWLGNESMFRPRDGRYVLQVTDELREILYLDEAKLVVADHPAGTEVHPTSKLRPAKPFPAPQLVTLGDRIPLVHAERLDGTDVTQLLVENDGRVVSPTKLRVPQLRGLAEPHGVVLDFGPLPKDRPLVLAMTGWLHFGGGMANIAASHNPDLSFPFPVLEAQTPQGWKQIDVVVGAPAGKTKTVLVDLTGKLPPQTTRLRLTTGFEIHWDRIAIFRNATPHAGAERSAAPGPPTAHRESGAVLAPASAHLHWRGFSRYAGLPWTVPLTPVYDKAQRSAPWLINPTGWCTRYGAVDELVATKDDALVILNAGDELTLEFPADQLPPKHDGMIRDFFLLCSGWDKDADYHVVRGDTVEPLPWHEMDDQRYGSQPRPKMSNDDWIRRYNTRWVGPLMLRPAR